MELSPWPSDRPADIIAPPFGGVFLFAKIKHKERGPIGPHCCCLLLVEFFKLAKQTVTPLDTF